MDKCSETRKINEIAEDLAKLKEVIQKNIATKDDIYMLKLDECCNSLSHAIIFDSLDLPSISSFSFFLKRLNDYGVFKYVLQRIHECWMLANYSTFLDSPTKEKDTIELIQSALSKYTSNRCNTDYDIVQEELNAPINTIIASTYYKKMMGNKRIEFYRTYLNELYKEVKGHTYIDCYSIGESFIPVCSLNVNLSRTELCALFTELVSAGYIEDNDANKHSFLALFSNTLQKPYAKIKWLDKNKKNNTPSIASLYTLFISLEIEMTPRNKKIICSLFDDADGEPISVERLKPRGDSANQKTIAQIASKYIEAHKK